MKDDKLAELFKTQKSLIELFEDIKHPDAAIIRQEDNEKRERLKVLNKVIGLPFDRPTQFDADELRDDNKKFIKFLEERGDELCSLRLMPRKGDLPKLRMRGKTIKDSYAWFKAQNIAASEYRADFVPHTNDCSWATIFIVNEHGIQGEIIYGGHHQLTQGFHDSVAPSVFRYDFKSWSMLPHNDTAQEYLKKLINFIYVPDHNKQEELKHRLGASFTHDYLMGYFETTDSVMGTWYIDYNQSLGGIYANTVVKTESPKGKALVVGQAASPGKAQGKVCIVDPDNLEVNFPANGILVCSITTPAYVPLMQKASAIVTDQGGILSHAAIVARELHKPCIVGTGNATARLKNDDFVLVDADAGTVNKVV